MSPDRRYLLLVLSLVISITNGESNLTDYKQDWGFIEARPGAQIFYWLFYATSNTSNPCEKPLIIWLQGGPGIAASCYGNFLEIGPLNIALEERRDAWTKDFNVLFIDYPAEVGFSHRTGKRTKLPKNVTQVGDDLIGFAREFFGKFESFRKSSLYVFGQSYGAKFAAELAVRLHRESRVGNMEVNLKGFGSFGGYISPIDFISNYGKVGVTLGLLDHHKYKMVEKEVRKIKSAINRGKFKKAQVIDRELFIRVFEGFDTHNFLEPVLNVYDNQFKTRDICEEVMENIVRPHLKLNDSIFWNYFNTDCYGVLQNELLQPVTDRVEYLLNNTTIKVLVFSGMLDFLVNVAGTVDWVGNLNWYGNKSWKEKTQSMIVIDEINEGFVRKNDRLSLYIVQRSGHSIPKDNPKAVIEILRREIPT